MDKTKKEFQLVPYFMTFVVSGFWHGLAPGLAVFSYGCFCLTTMHNNIKRAELPKFVSRVPKEFWMVLSFFYVHFMNSVFGMCFVWKFHSVYINMLRAFDFWPLIILGAGLCASFGLPKKIKSKKE